MRTIRAGARARRLRIWLLRTTRSDRGAATVEFTGAIVIASILVLSVATAFTLQSTDLGKAVASGICKVVTFGQGDCGSVDSGLGDKPDRTPTEPCVVSSNTVSTSTEVAVVIVTAKDGRVFEVAKMSDGRYRITKSTTAGVGVETGVGAGATVIVNDKRFGGNAVADVGAGLEFRGGEVFYVDSAEAASRLIGEEQEDTVEDGVLGDSGPARWLWERGQDAAGAVTGNGDYEFPDPDEVYAEGGVVLNASAEATAFPNSASANGSVSETLGVRTTKGGQTTIYLKSTVQASALVHGPPIFNNSDDPLDPSFPGGGAEGKLDLLTAVTFDSAGNMVEVNTTATAAGQSKGVVTALFGGDLDADVDQSESSVNVYKSTLPIKSSQDRDTALAFLAASGVQQLGGPGVQLATLPASIGAIHQFQQAAADHGTVTQQHLTYDGTTVFGVEAAGKLELELGVKADVSTNSQTSTGAKYWDGSQWQTWEGCAAG